MTNSGFDLGEAQEQMTLAALAYSGDKESTNIVHITEQINFQLKNPLYATGGKWRCVWGPILGTYGNNVTYVAKKEGEETYSLVIRGTTMSVRSWWEDIPTGQSDFSMYTAGTASTVSDHFMDGMNGTLKAISNGQTIEEFLNALGQKTPDLKLFVTGHSQGGGLTPMYFAWVLNLASSWAANPAAAIKGYGFAPPTSGNDKFADWITKNANCIQVANPLDTVPKGYAGIDSILEDGIPESVPLYLYPVIETARGIAWASGPWKQPDPYHVLSAVPMDPAHYDFLDMVEGQHNKNSYLALLGATQTCLPGPSPLPGAHKYYPTLCPVYKTPKAPTV